MIEIRKITTYDSEENKYKTYVVDSSILRRDATDVEIQNFLTKQNINILINKCDLLLEALDSLCKSGDIGQIDMRSWEETIALKKELNKFKTLLEVEKES